MSGDQDVLLLVLILLFAALYSTVGQGGGSGYLAAMAMVGLAPETLRPAALAMNIAVSVLVVWRYSRAGLIDWTLIRPFLAASIPTALLGGMLTLDPLLFRWLVGALLIVASLWLIARPAPVPAPRPPGRGIAVLTGGGVGLLSGLTGIGGAILLAPLMHLFHWAEPRVCNGVAGVFVLLNSVAGLSGLLLVGAGLPPALPLWMLAAVAGGLVGSGLGLRRFDGKVLRRLLALVLVVAGVRLVWG